MRVHARAAAPLLISAVLSVEPSLAQSTTGQPDAVRSSASTDAPASPAVDLASIEPYIVEALQAWRVPGAAVAVIKGDQVVLLKGFGFADVKKQRPVTPDTLFAAASTTKAFTSFGLGLLADEGKITFDTPLIEYVPTFRMKDDKATPLVTLRDMLSHRTGLPRHDALWYNKNDYRICDLPPLFANLASSEPIRAGWQYNNLMYMTAGCVAQQKSGATSWEAFTRDRILKPLGMNRTNFSVDDMAKDRDAALAYKLDEKRNVILIPYRNVDAIGPAGSINTTARDMAQWLRVHMNGGRFGGKSIINPATLADIHSPLLPVGGKPEFNQFSQPFYGMGWFVDTYRGHRRVQHGGNLDGFTARVTFFPDDGIGTVILMNMEATPLPGHLSLDIADRQLGLAPVDWARKMLARRDVTEKAGDVARGRKSELKVAGTQPSHPLSAYAGSYVHPAYGPLKVEEANGRLFATYNGMVVDLDHWHYDIFNGDPRREQDDGFEDLKFQFDTDLNGRIAGLRVGLEPAVEPIAFTRSAEAKLSDPAYLRRFVGKYRYLDRTITIELVGDHLVLEIPGQERQKLKGDIDGSFALEEARDISLVFRGSPDKVSGFSLRQPNGVFDVERIPDSTSPPIVTP